MPNFLYMSVQWAYLLALAIWVGGMIGFIVLFVPSLTHTLKREQTGTVIADFLPRFRAAVAVCVGILAVTSAVRFALWETVTPWLLIRWAALGGMAGLAAYDFSLLAPRLKAAKEEGDKKLFARLHAKATLTMGLTLLLGLVALFFS